VGNARTRARIKFSIRGQTGTVLRLWTLEAPMETWQEVAAEVVVAGVVGQ